MNNYTAMIALLVIVIASSCSQKVILVQEAYYVENNKEIINSASDVDLETYYLADNGIYTSFEIVINNRSQHRLLLSNQDIEFKLLYPNKTKTLYPIESEQVLKNLYLEEELLIGVNNVSSVGIGPKSILANGVRNSLYRKAITSRRKDYKMTQGSTQERMQYLIKYTLDEEIIEPETTVSFDIYFTRILTNCKSKLIVYQDKVSHISEYDLVIREMKK